MSFRLEVPATPKAAFELLEAAGAPAPAILAGGTDLLLDLDSGHLEPSVVVSLRRLPWRDVRWSAERLFIGATLPLGELESDAELRRRLPGLYGAIRSVGSRALRHRATFGGNLARAAPASDLIPISIALDGVVHLESARGARTLPIEQFVLRSRHTALAPGELIRGVELAIAPSTYLWQRVRPANDISQVGAAVAHPPGSGWRIALGGVTPASRRLPAAEAALSERPTAEEIGSASELAARHAAFATDRRASEAYRRQVLRVLVARAIGSVGRAGAA
jgi:CO/xanthine dehydrogenase FAD-binding subunit